MECKRCGAYSYSRKSSLCSKCKYDLKIEKAVENAQMRAKNLHIHAVSSSFYSDGNDYSHLEVNSEQFPEHEECVMCGSTSVTITDDKDICHNCGYVYE